MERIKKPIYCNECLYFRHNILSMDKKAMCSDYCAYNFRISENNKNNDCNYFKKLTIFSYLYYILY